MTLAYLMHIFYGQLRVTRFGLRVKNPKPTTRNPQPVTLKNKPNKNKRHR
jgi:hypothetical protein